MEIRKARLDDLGRIMDIYHYAQDFMIASGNPNQWSHVYPKQELIEQDIADEISYVLCDGDIVLAVFALLSGDDPTYDGSTAAPGRTTSLTSRSTARQATAAPMGSST